MANLPEKDSKIRKSIKKEEKTMELSYEFFSLEKTHSY